MELIFLHGPPAVGKRTVARTLMQMIPARLMDNHATIDLGQAIFDFGTREFWDLVYALRLDILKAAAQSDLPYLITTACYVHPDDLPIVENWETALNQHDARLRPIHLTCAPEVLARRVVHPDRIKQGKLSSVEGLNDYLSRNDFRPFPHPDCISIDTGQMTPTDAARHIKDQCGFTGRSPA